MGKCIICGCETDDFRCFVREENGIKHNDYQCEKCTIKKVKEQRAMYEKRFNKDVLPYLLKNNFKVVVSHCVEDREDVVEEFPIKDSHLMYCVGIIRKRMEDEGYEERWIDIHWETYADLEFEIVDYLYFEERDNETNCECYYFELIGDNDLKLKATY